jgi:hypothetical protein
MVSCAVCPRKFDMICTPSRGDACAQGSGSGSALQVQSAGAPRLRRADAYTPRRGRRREATRGATSRPAYDVRVVRCLGSRREGRDPRQARVLRLDFDSQRSKSEASPRRIRILLPKRLERANKEADPLSRRARQHERKAKETNAQRSACLKQDRVEMCGESSRTRRLRHPPSPAKLHATRSKDIASEQCITRNSLYIPARTVSSKR